jgi:hypothetical protein
MSSPNASESYPFDPDLAADYARELDILSDRILKYPNEGEEILEREIDRVETTLDTDEPDEERVCYLAVLEVLLDLLEIDYQLLKEDGSLRVVKPDIDADAQSPQEYKQHEREVLKKERDAQFEDESTYNFIKEMERSRGAGGTGASIEQLVVDSDELYRDLAQINDWDRDAIIDELDELIQPYIQVAIKGETDRHTGLDLQDIWRYFRYTWLTPYNTVPGRNINFLIRDAARPNHPVMGIASLGSSMMNLTDRDDYIGWTIDALEDRLERKQRTLEYEETLPKDERTEERTTRTVTRTEYLESESEWHDRIDTLCERYRTISERALAESIETIRYDDFIEGHDGITAEDFEKATDDVFTHLKQIEGKARYVLNGEPDLDAESTSLDLDLYDLSRRDLDDIEYTDTDPGDLDSWYEKSETALFVRKRAETLQKLLRDRRYFRENAEKSDREFIEDALEDDDGRRAIKTGLKEVKKRRVGAGMMNIMVCGAIPPYNHILGGKLVAMALTGPKVIDAYREKYEGAQSKIASSMAGETVIKESELVLLDTTGLFEVGSAQYDRVRIPVDDDRMEFKQVGKTSGYGSVQFGAKTRQRLAEVTAFKEGQKQVRGRFGEGIAPRLRKIRRGLDNLGLPGELLRHESPRLVYAVELATNAEQYLLGETDEPSYYWSFDDTDAEQQLIYDHWKDRWVSKRIQKDEILQRIAEFDARSDLLIRDKNNFDDPIQASIEEFSDHS